MGSFAKWIASGLGFVLGGPIGAIVGFVIGSIIDDTTLQTTTYTTSPGRTSPGDFGISLLVLIAAMMKADDRVVKSELDYVKKFFIQNFGQSTASEALIMLRDMLKQDIPVTDVCDQISENMDYSSRLQLLHLLFDISIADNAIHASELELIERMSGYLGIAFSDFLSIRNMFIPETDSYYKILEIDPSATDEEVKKAYRRMAMKYHPDKVNHLGEEFRKIADEKIKKVNQAYEKIKNERGT